MLVLTDLEPDRIARQRERDEFFWLDLQDPAPDVLARAGDELGLHAVAVEDSREWRQRPKVDAYEDHLLLVFYAARIREGEDAEPVEVHVYVSGAFVMTVRRGPCAALEALHRRLADAPTEDEGSLVHRILDALTDTWFPVIDALEARIDALEAAVFLRARSEQLQVIYRLRQDVRELWRVAGAQRDHFAEATQAIRAIPGLSHGTQEWLRDVADHLVQIGGELSRQTDDLNALTGTYFNANADRLNAVATRLTVVGTLFVVATIVTGFFGQNFGWLVDHIGSERDFLIFGVGGLVVPVALTGAVLWFKRRDLF